MRCSILGKIKKLLYIFFLQIAFFVNFASGGSSFLTKNAIIDAWESSYFYKIKNLKVEYSRHLIDNNFDGTKMPPGVNIKDIVKNYYELRTYEYLGKKYYAESSNSKEDFLDSNLRTKHAFNGENTSSFYPSENLGVIRPGLTGRGIESEKNIKPIMFMNTIKSKSHKDKYPFGVPIFSLIFNSEKTQVLKSIEQIIGEPCHVMVLNFKTSENHEGYYKIWIAHDKNMMPLKYEKYENEKLVEEINVKAIGKVDTEIGPIFYPNTAIRTYENKLLGRITNKYKIYLFKPNIKISDDTFKVEFPPNAKIIDKVAGMEYELVGSEIDSLPKIHSIEASPAEKTKPIQDVILTETSNSSTFKMENNKQTLSNKNLYPQDKKVITKFTEPTNNLKIKVILVLITVVIVIGGLLLFLQYKKQTK